MCSDFFRDICICVSPAENSVEKQGIPKGYIMEFVSSSLICREDKIFMKIQSVQYCFLGGLEFAKSMYG